MHLQEQQPAHVSHRFFPSLCEHLIGKQTMGRIFIHNIMCTQRQGLACLFLGLCLLLSRRCSALQLWKWRERVTEPAVPSVEFESSAFGSSHMETPSRSPACSKMELQPPHSSYCTAHVLMFTLSVSSNWWGADEVTFSILFVTSCEPATKRKQGFKGDCSLPQQHCWPHMLTLSFLTDSPAHLLPRNPTLMLLSASLVLLFFTWDQLYSGLYLQYNWNFIK